jgi:hypothetical protein
LIRGENIMKKLIIVLLSVCSIAAVAAVFNELNFSSAGRMYEPMPTGYVAGKDNDKGSGIHHQGEDCGRCHSLGLRAESHLFTMGGTLYSDRSGRSVLKGGEIVLEDREGNIISMTSNEAGNFWTSAPLASNPYTVVSHGGPPQPLYVLDAQGNLATPADPTDERTWLYKTWVHKGNAIRPMVTIAPVGSAAGMDMRMSCSMHHANNGSRGALWVSSAPTLPAYPAVGLGYRKHIYPILRSKCSPCHIPGTTMTRIVTKSDIDTPSTSIDHSGGLDLMTYEGSTVGTVVKQGVCSVVDTAHPAKSQLLLKTTPGAMHAGGTFWNERSPDYIALRQWITEGAHKN